MSISLSTYIHTYFEKEKLGNLKSQMETELYQMSKQNGYYVSNLLKAKVFNALKEYLEEKLSNVLGRHFENHPVFVQEILKDCQSSKAGRTRRLSWDKDVDMNKVARILINLLDWNKHDKFKVKDDFESGDSKSRQNFFMKLRQQLRDIQIAIDKDEDYKSIESREAYDSLQTIQCFFESFKKDGAFKISANRHNLIECINNYRLFMLDRMVIEEQIKQILRSADCAYLDYEFRGCFQRYQRLIKHPSMNLVDCTYQVKEDLNNADYHEHFRCQNLFQIEDHNCQDKLSAKQMARSPSGQSLNSTDESQKNESSLEVQPQAQQNFYLPQLKSRRVKKSPSYRLVHVDSNENLNASEFSSKNQEFKGDFGVQGVEGERPQDFQSKAVSKDTNQMNVCTTFDEINQIMNNQGPQYKLGLDDFGDLKDSILQTPTLLKESIVKPETDKKEQMSKAKGTAYSISLPNYATEVVVETVPDNHHQSLSLHIVDGGRSPVRKQEKPPSPEENMYDLNNPIRCTADYQSFFRGMNFYSPDKYQKYVKNNCLWNQASIDQKDN